LAQQPGAEDRINDEGEAFNDVRAYVVNSSHQAHWQPCPQSASDEAVPKKIRYQTGGQARSRRRGAP
jgi:hypothetical protein